MGDPSSSHVELAIISATVVGRLYHCQKEVAHGSSVTLVRTPDNPFDTDAIQVRNGRDVIRMRTFIRDCSVVEMSGTGGERFFF